MATLDQKPRSGSERRWRRLSLWSLILLVPLALLETSYDSAKELWRTNDLWPRDVAAGQPAQFGGSQWQFVSIKPADGVKSRSLPSGSVPLIAQFVVEVGNPDLQTLWLGCSIKLVQSDGRTWLPTSIPGMPYRGESVKSCASATFSGAGTGERMVIEENFLVPAALVNEVRPTLGLGSERPRYLRFDRPV